MNSFTTLAPTPADLAPTATKGLFRLVGGRISKTNPVILKTPTAATGIRGGIAVVNAPGAGSATTWTFLIGEQMDVTAGGVTKSVTRPGFSITVTGRMERQLRSAIRGSLVIRNDRVQLAGWVSGELSDLTSGVLANQPKGSATYTGHMYESVQTVISSVTYVYQASGTYTNVWNFDTDTGSVTLGNLTV